ncbi:glycoside hydrolase family 31 protein [Paucilactobacillus suebicus]|uniref:Glycoside hydrolase family protein n=1 Tax=Paucilactobacillus suebicus DSM 5007 = KCTC 3549 TaxID=1423807 RepID=A0A0R1W4L8_9LACO|nr:glycoside hydrolase family 31 protein [Paucilactobacillus suebicus]KRM12615.1 glycoside hydrolase family protein [Paucilactobacillus suebicus DSM 5007 = KCTC 3549]
MLYKKDGSLYIKENGSTMIIQPWGENSFRVRNTKYSEFTDLNNALTMPVAENYNASIEISSSKRSGKITNGNITAEINYYGDLSFYNENGETLLKGWQRTRTDYPDPASDDIAPKRFKSSLDLDWCSLQGNPGGDFKLNVRFEANKDEKIFGMGQYQEDYIDLKGSKLELALRNSQASVPFYISNKGYGFLWNNPAVGAVSFAKNITEWTSYATKEMDFWITSGDSPASIEEQYAKVAGTVPMMPDYAMGYWQCKLRYQTQDELLEAAHEFKKRNLPISVIVIDFFHWPKSGEFKFDEKYWPDPNKMADELHKMGIKLMVSVWPTVDETSSHYKEMADNGYLVKTDRGVEITMNFLGNNGFVDFTNPDAQNYVWKLLKKNYYDKGVDLFWLDEAEPEYSAYDFDNYRYQNGSVLEVGNLYPVGYAKTIFDGLKTEGKTNIISLVRSAWAGSQKYGALVWSGDIDSSFESMRRQLAIGLNMGIAGIPWWTTDIGGFTGGNINDPVFKQLVVRWTQFATFCPVMRMHGSRDPFSDPLSDHGGGKMGTGAPTEPWAYGEKAYAIITKYMHLRENLRDYIKIQMANAHDKGTPVIRPLFYDFSNDNNSWNIEDEYMFGDSVLISPILYEDENLRNVYLPEGTRWTNAYTGEVINGGQNISVSAPLDQIPIFVRSDRYDQLNNAFDAIR